MGAHVCLPVVNTTGLIIKSIPDKQKSVLSFILHNITRHGKVMTKNRDDMNHSVSEQRYLFNVWVSAQREMEPLPPPPLHYISRGHQNFIFGDHGGTLSKKMCLHFL